MKSKKWLTSAVALTLVGSLAVGCSSGGSGSGSESPSPTPAPSDASTPAPESNVPQVITMNLTSEPEALDLSKSTTVTAATIINAITDGLYRVDKDGHLTLGVAKDFPKVSEDGLTYTIDLKDNVKWSDGKVVTAHDFVYSFQRTANPETKAQYSFMMEWLENGADIIAEKKPVEELGVKALSDFQLEIKLVSPMSYFDSILAFPTFYPQRQDIVEQYGDKYAADADKVIGNGPFKLTSWNHEQNMTLEKNADYWDADSVHLEKVTLNMIKDANTSLNLYETKEIDYTSLSGDHLPLFEGKEDVKDRPELVNAYVMFQTNHPVLSNANIRKALTTAIDRQAYVDVVLKNGSKPATGLVPYGTLDGNGKEFREVAGNDLIPPFDPEKGKELLAQGLKELGLSALPKLQLTSDDTSGAKKNLEFLTGQWKENLGIDIEAESLPFAARVEKSQSKNFDMVISLWGADYNDAMSFMDLFLNDSPMNYVNYKSDAYTEKVKAAQKETDLAKRSQLLVEAEKQIMEDAPIGMLYFRNAKYLVRPNIEDLILAPLGYEFDLKWTKVK